MNKLFTSLGYFLIFLTFSSQDCFQASKANWGDDSLKCRKNVSLYSEFMKQKFILMLLSFGEKLKFFVLNINLTFIKTEFTFTSKLQNKKRKTNQPISSFM